MVWTTPRTWVTGETVTAANMNLHVRDNLNYLFSQNLARGSYIAGADYTTTGTSFANVDATNVTFNVTSAGGAYDLCFMGRALGSSSAVNVMFDIAVDGTRLGNSTMGLITVNTTTGSAFTVIAPTVLSAGTRTITLQWRVDTGTGTLDATQAVNWWYKGN